MNTCNGKPSLKARSNPWLSWEEQEDLKDDYVDNGGSGSGKSAYAESVITGFGDFERIYIATMYPFDEESHARIGGTENAGEKEFSDPGVLYRIEEA